MSESNSKDKIIIESKPKEESKSDSISAEQSNSSQPESSISHDIQNDQQEQAELSEIETGNKDQPDFEEIINFNHTYLNYRITKVFSEKASLDNSTFNLLTTNVFIYSGDIIDFKAMTSLSNTDAVKNIR